MTGNMTCSVSLTQSAIFPVEYRNQTNLFIVNGTAGSSVSTISPALMRGAINSMGHVIWGSQQYEANFVGESVITFGVKSYKLQPFDQSETYLRLYEAMIQGLLDYQVCTFKFNSQSSRCSDLFIIVNIHSFIVFGRQCPADFDNQLL